MYNIAGWVHAAGYCTPARTYRGSELADGIQSERTCASVGSACSGKEGRCEISDAAAAKQRECKWPGNDQSAVDDLNIYKKHSCCWDSMTAAFTRWQHFCINDTIATILKLWYHIRNLTPSIDAYLLEEQYCWISSRSDLKRRSLVIFLNFVKSSHHQLVST